LTARGDGEPRHAETAGDRADARPSIRDEILFPEFGQTPGWRVPFETGRDGDFGRRAAGTVPYLCETDIALRLRVTAGFDLFGRQAGGVRVCRS